MSDVRSIIASCSWCHRGNDVTAGRTFCAECGHRADVARIFCDCDRCRAGGRATIFWPLDLADAVARGAIETRPPMTVAPTSPPCSRCTLPADAHSLEQARACLAVLIDRESNYCRLTGPKR